MKNINKTFITIVVCLMGIMAYGQAKKPSIMFAPDDNWCKLNGYTMQFNNQGKNMELPDYQKALLEDSELNNVIAKLNQLMSDRGFPADKDLAAALKSVNNQSAEDALLTSKGGADINESPIDKLKKTAKADIWILVNWQVKNEGGPKKSISFTLKAIDAYTDQPVATSQGTGNPSFEKNIDRLLEEAVIGHIDVFNAQLQSHFDDMFSKGRKITLRVLTWSDFDGDLESEYEGKELNEIIENWVSENTVKNRFSTADATENMMLFENVRIPLYDESNKALDARNWGRQLSKMLKDKYKINSKVMTKGLGQVQLVIGSK